MIGKFWQRWHSTTALTPPDEPSYTDQHTTQRDALRRDLRDVEAALARDEAHWSKLVGRDDPEAWSERAVAWPRILDLRQQRNNLLTVISDADAAIATNAALYAQVTQLVQDTEPWITALLATLPSEADIVRAYQASRSLDRVTAELLRGTGDRKAFRRPVLDPYAALRDALDACLRVHAKQRLLRSLPTRDERTAS